MARVWQAAQGPTTAARTGSAVVLARPYGGVSCRLATGADERAHAPLRLPVGVNVAT